MLTHAELLQLKRWNTPTIYNGWEQITKHDHAHEGVNLEEVRDFMPQMGPMVGYAVTLVVEPGNPKHKENAGARGEYLKYVASIPGPKIAVVQHPPGLGMRRHHYRWGNPRSGRDDQCGPEESGPAAVRRPRPRDSGAMELRG
jgi:hypothetical protein